jgi:hypothetical protein
MPKPSSKNQKIQGTQPATGKQSSAASTPVERAAKNVEKPAQEPVDRTAELLGQELEVSKAGIPSPDNEEHRPAR